MEIDKNMLNEFIIEAKEHLENIEDNFLSLEKQKDQPDPKLIDQLFRSIHSIKGSSGFLNLKSITQLAHMMEALLQKMREKSLLPDSNNIDSLLAASDLLRKMITDPLRSIHTDTKEIIERLMTIDKPNKDVSIPENSTQSTLNMTKKSENKPINDHSVKIPLSILNDIGLKCDKTELNNLKYKNLFLLQYNLIDLEKDSSISLQFLIKDLMNMGHIIDCQIKYDCQDFEASFDSIPFELYVFYSTDLDEQALPITLNINEKQIINMNIISEHVENINLQEGMTQLPDIPVKPLEKKQISPIKTNKIIPPIDQENTKPTERAKQETTQPINMPIDKIDHLSKENSHDQNCSNNMYKTPEEIKKDQNETIRIHVNLLDRIMKLAGELVLVRNQHLRLVDKTDIRLADNSQRLDMVTSELQEAIMRTRMQPIGNLFNRLPRIVRDISKKCGKSIIILINGNDVELDKTILDTLPDPLMHIIRNCCDHGIEIPEDRVKKGKAETGYIKVNAYHEAGQINIVIEDDGIGLNPLILKQKAIEKGLKREDELNRMLDKEILSLIMYPGFSTALKTTEISGRGVGMDVVKTVVEQLGGFIDIESRVDMGSVFHLRLPLTLAIIPSLIVEVDEERFAIPEVNVEELVSLYDREIYSSLECNGDQEVFRLRNNLLPIVRLKEVLAHKNSLNETHKKNISEKYKRLANEKLSTQTEVEEIMVFAVLKIGGQRFGLIVDQVLGTEEIVVNPLHSIIKPLNIYSGTTIMGDGTVSLILDVNGLAKHACVKFSSEGKKQITHEKEKSKFDSHRVLLFKSGLSERLAVPLMLMRRVELINKDNIQIIGNRDYISIDNVPTLILKLDEILNISACDMKDKMYLLLPKQPKRPMGILASELIDVVNMPLELNKESFMEDGILGTSIFNDIITIFLDIYRLIERSEIKWFGNQASFEQTQKERIQVLLAEDTLFFQRLVKGHLESAGYEVFTAENGVQALSILNKQKIDVIVSDIEMPEMDGRTFIKKVRSQKQYDIIPAIALTSLDSDEDRQKGLDAGFDAYEVKIDRENLIRVIKKLLSK